MDSPFQGARKAEFSSPPPPLYIHYLPKGEIRSAWRSAEAPYSGPRRPRGAKKAGMIYQRKVEAWPGWTGVGGIELSPWFCFTDGSRERHYCQPDLLIFHKDLLIVGEIKIRWTADAWWQLRKLYLPVLSKVFPGRILAPLCVCRSFDPAVVFPEPAVLRGSIPECDPETFNVLLVP
jgi:hypothetical protein